MPQALIRIQRAWRRRRRSRADPEDPCVERSSDHGVLEKSWWDEGLSGSSSSTGSPCSPRNFMRLYPDFTISCQLIPCARLHHYYSRAILYIPQKISEKTEYLPRTTASRNFWLEDGFYRRLILGCPQGHPRTTVSH